MLSTFVKVGRVSNLSDARYCAGMMVDALGFCMDPQSPDYIPVETFHGISQWISGPEFIGETGSLALADILIDAKKYGFSTLETGDEEKIQSLKSEGYEVVFRFRIDTPIDLEAFLNLRKNQGSQIRFYVVETHPSLLEMVVNEGFNDVIISIEGIEQHLEILKSGPFKGIELVATPEEKPGFKDYGNVMEVLEALEV